MFRNRISLFVATFLIIGFFFLALPEKGLGQTGCCLEPTNGGTTCLGCAQADLDCISVSTQSFCDSQGGAFTDNLTCGNLGQGSGAQCLNIGGNPTGCCVIEDGCVFGTTEDECFVAASSELWVSSETLSCENVPECAPPIVTNVPTLSEWGLIAMAGILGIIGFIMVIRRRKVTA